MNKSEMLTDERKYITEMYGSEIDNKCNKNTSRRDKIATSVLASLIIIDENAKHHYRGCENLIQDICRLSYLIADAMIYQSEKESRSDCSYLLKPKQKTRV